MEQTIGNVNPQVAQRSHMVKNGTADTIVRLPINLLMFNPLVTQKKRLSHLPKLKLKLHGKNSVKNLAVTSDHQLTQEHVDDDVDNNNNYNTSSDGGEIDVEVKGKGTTHAGTTSDSVGLEEDLENEMREQQKNIEKNIKVFTNYHLLWCCGTSQNDHFFGC